MFFIHVFIYSFDLMILFYSAIVFLHSFIYLDFHNVFLLIYVLLKFLFNYFIDFSVNIFSHLCVKFSVRFLSFYSFSMLYIFFYSSIH